VDGPTASLLWESCRPHADERRVAGAVHGGADLQSATAAALTQRVSPLLWRALTTSGVVAGRENEGWARQLRDDAARCRARALILLPQLAPRVLAPLADAGVMPLVYKGAALVDRYPEVGLRPMDDVDLVLPPAQLDVAVVTLQRAGWRVVPVRRATHHELILTHDALPGLPVELHRALATWRERSNRLETLDLWRWRVLSPVLGEPAFTLPAEEEIVALVAHAAKPFHIFDRLIWAVDVAVVIEDANARNQPVDWDRVEGVARGVRCRTALAVALTQVARLGVTSPAELRQSPATNARGRALVPVLSEEWPLLERDWSMRRRLRYALVDDWRQRVTLFVGQIIRYGPARAPRDAIKLSVVGVRRWWRLRREVPRAKPDREPEQPIER